LSVGQYVGVSGKEFIRGLALGSEVTARLIDVLGHYRSRNRFRQNGGGAIGAALTAGVLLGLDAQQLESALGLAASGACGLPSHHLEELHQLKSLNHGRAAEAGVLSALLARQGFHGPSEVLTIKDGFFDVFLGLTEAGDEVVAGLGETYLMRDIAYKRYSVAASGQAILYAFFQLIKKHNLTDEDIEQIELPVVRGSMHTSKTNRHPALHMETVLSLAAVYGELTFMHVHDHSYRENLRLKAFQERARILAVPVTTEQRLETGITVQTRNGNVLRHDLIYPSMTDQEIQQKFRNLAGLRLDSSGIADLETKLRAIETSKNIAPLVGELALDY
jgi:2-methylcitrate dehydratase PrpD